MKKLKVLILMLCGFLSIFFVGTSVSAAESNIENQIVEEVTDYVADGTLASWHLNYVNDEGYQAYYWKQVHFGSGISYFASLTYQDIRQISSWYWSQTDETWEYIFNNLDIEPEYLEPDKYLGLYWDSYYNDDAKEGRLYLIWTSHYTPSEFVVLTKIKEGNKVYNFYDDEKAMENLDSNWLWTNYYHFKENNLTLHITAIAGYENGEHFGLPLKQTYNFQGFSYAVDDAEWTKEPDPKNEFSGSCADSITFNLGLTPKLDGKNAMQLVTHAYEIIKQCEVQSHFDFLAYGGYGHFAYFNTSINIDKIYRVDVSYKVTNDEKQWYEFWLPSDEHQITKSLTTEKVSGGIFGLYKFQGFSEGSYASTVDGTTNYKYRLHLNYDDTAWNWFVGQEYYECDYKRVSQFQILRMNYLVDEKVYDVAIKMDTIEGDTLFILDKDLILDTETAYYNFKNWLDDSIAELKEKFKDYLPYLYAVLGVVATVLLIWVISKVYRLFKFLFGWIPDNKDDNQKKKE